MIELSELGVVKYIMTYLNEDDFINTIVRNVFYTILVIFCIGILPSHAAKELQLNTLEVLPSWNNTYNKQQIIAFVNKVTTPGSPEFVPVEQRIATFDNDGTLWVEQPMYVQLIFAIDRVNTLAPQHPEWTTKEPFASLL